MPARTRSVSIALATLAAGLIAVADIGIYADRTVFDSGEFADRVTRTLDDEAVRSEVGRTVTDQVVGQQPDLLAVRPIVEAIVQGAIGTGAFRSLLRDSAQGAHGLLFGRDDDSTVLTVVDAGALVTTALGQIAPRLARQIPPGLDVKLVELSDSGDGALAADLAQAAEDTRYGSLVAAVLGMLALLGSVLLAPDRRRGLARAGFAVAAAGALVVIAFYAARAYVAARGADPQASDALRAVWATFFLDLRDWSLLLVIVGLAVAGATRGALPELHPQAALSRAAKLLGTVPSGTAARALRAVALIVIGVLTLIDHEAILTLLAFALGAALVYAGIAELTAVALPPDLESADQSAVAHRRQRSMRVAFVAAGVSGILAVGVTGVVSADDSDKEPFAITACNGSSGLCDRDLAHVVFPTTHNSMSAASEPGWIFGNQNDGVTAQLSAGVRGLMIDTHYGVKTRRGVYTVLERDTKSREKLEAAVGKEGVKLAERLRERIGYKGDGKEEIFFCHGFCELGATKGDTLLGEIRDFLASHPYEVLMISVEDGVTPEDAAALFQRSGLLNYVYRGKLDPLPTLRELIESGERVIVMGEENVGDVPWYRQQFELASETPYEFATPGELEGSSSCQPNRGEPSNPLLIVNHWVDTPPAPRVSNARKVNARAVLLERARRCARERDRTPNLLAVDLYREGDLLDVARELNSQRGP